MNQRQAQAKMFLNYWWIYLKTNAYVLMTTGAFLAFLECSQFCLRQALTASNINCSLFIQYSGHHFHSLKIKIIGQC